MSINNEKKKMKNLSNGSMHELENNDLRVSVSEVRFCPFPWNPIRILSLSILKVSH